MKSITYAKPEEFLQKLLAGEVRAFDITQGCHEGGEYTRCFYTLIGKDIVYEETSCKVLRIHWEKIDGKLKRCYRTDDNALWRFIKKHYVRTERDYQVIYQRISGEKSQ